MEEEKLKQLRIISEQNRAKKAAKQAQRSGTKKDDQFALPQNYQQEFLAKDGNMQVYGQKQVINGPSKTGGLGLQVTGAKLKENIPLASAVVAPAAQFNFKVVSYEQGDRQQNPMRTNYDYNNAPSNPQVNNMPSCHDQEQDRNIDMNELHELLGN